MPNAFKNTLHFDLLKVPESSFDISADLTRMFLSPI